MLISVVVLTYNHEEYLEQSIDSILDQKGDFKLEVLIGNDASPDNTKEILKKYGLNPKVKIYNREKNMGASKNLYDLLTKSKGEYIAILEGDDYWTDVYKLEKQVKFLEKNREYVMSFTESYTIDKNGKEIGEKLLKKSEIVDLEDLLFNRAEIATGTIIFRNVFLNNNDNRVKKLLTSGNIICDLSLFSYLIKFGKFYNLREKTGAYRYINKNSTSYSSMAEHKQLLEMERVIKGVLEFYSENKFVKNYLLRTQRKLLKKTKDKEIRKEYLNSLELKEKLELIMFIILSPINNLIYSIKKTKNKKSSKI